MTTKFKWGKDMMGAKDNEQVVGTMNCKSQINCRRLLQGISWNDRICGYRESVGV